MAKKRGGSKKGLTKLSAKTRGKLWGGMKLTWKSFRASIAVLKNKKASKVAKGKARKRLEKAKKAIHNFQGKLGLRPIKWKGIAA